LLFGRTVKGPLALVKNAWMGKSKLITAKANVVQYILDIRQRLRDAMALATTHATKERQRSKTWYDRKSRMRSFQPGQKVLALLPFPGKALQVKYYGPYVVIEKLGPVDYVIATPDRRKAQRVCHINLLKQYREQDKQVFSATENVVKSTNVNIVDSISDCSPLTLGDADTKSDEVFKHLVGEQRQQLDVVLSEFAEVFSDKPGRTNLCTHHIELLPDSKPIRCRPYRVQTKLNFLKKKSRSCSNLVLFLNQRAHGRLQ